MKFRKKPVVIDAIEFQPGIEIRDPRLVQGVYRDGPHKGIRYAYVETLEGRMMVSPGDFIITGVKNELYPCKPDIFKATYDACNGERPAIVCLCGSTRFMGTFFAAGWGETLAGRIVLSVGVALHMDTPDGGHAGEAMGEEVKTRLDELHKRKIDLADEVLILNVDDYVGASTAGELAYAREHGKKVRWLERTTRALAGEENGQGKP